MDTKGSIKREPKALRHWTGVAVMALSLVLLGATCKNRTQGGEEGEELTAKRFVGPWVAAAVDVDIRTKNGIGGPEHLHFDSRELAADQGRKPALTIFNADGSYREETFNLKDSLLQTKAGFWHLYEDSLYMRLDVEGSPKIAFKAQLDGKGLKLFSTMDWDGDEARDDEMVVELRRP